MTANGICSAAFCESAALRGSTPSVIAYGDATFPKGTAFGNAGRFISTAKGVPLRADFPRPGEDVAQRQKGESGERSKD